MFEKQYFQTVSHLRLLGLDPYRRSSPSNASASSSSGLSRRHSSFHAGETGRVMARISPDALVQVDAGLSDFRCTVRSEIICIAPISARRTRRRT